MKNSLVMRFFNVIKDLRIFINIVFIYGIIALNITDINNYILYLYKSK